MIVVEADNLDGALAIAEELQETRTGGAIEVRPILEGAVPWRLTPSSASTGAGCWPPWSASSATSNWPRTRPQEAFAIAAERWPRDGEPANPAGWLISTARNRAIDHIRRQRVLAEKTKLLARELEPPETGGHRGRRRQLSRTSGWN